MEETRICKECGRELPLEMFKTTRWGDKVHVCNDCAAEKYRKSRANNKEQKVNKARSLRLEDFSPRELMEELARRGYKGELTYTRIETIDITNF